MIEDDAVKNNVLNTFPILKQSPAGFQKEFFMAAVGGRLVPGQIICDERDVCTHLALVLAGDVRVFKLAESGRELTLYRIEAGQSCVLTASCILSGAKFPASAVAETIVDGIMIPAKTVRAWMGQSELWRDFVFDLISQRLSEVITVVEEVAFKRMDARIASYLLKLSIGEEAIEITHQEIAVELGTARVVVSRILRDLEKGGMIHRSRGAIVVTDRFRLKAIVLHQTHS